MASASNDPDDGHYEDERPKRKEMSEKSMRAAATRAENNEKRRREEEQLRKETEGGRHAKNTAKANAVWKLVSSNREKKSAPHGSSTQKPSLVRSQAQSQRFDHAEDEQDDDDRTDGRGRGSVREEGQPDRSSTRLSNNEPARNCTCNDDHGRHDQNHNRGHGLEEFSTDEHPPERKKYKGQHHSRSRSSHSTRRKEGQSNNDDYYEDADDDGDSYRSDKSGAVSDFEDELDVDADLERPTFPAAARNLFDVADEDVLMGSHSRSSSRSATHPPSTDDDDFLEAVTSSKSSSSDVNNVPRRGPSTTAQHSSRRRPAYVPPDEESEHSLSASEGLANTNRGRVQNSGLGGQGKGGQRLEKRFNDERPQIVGPEPTRKKAKTGSAFDPNAVSTEVRIVHEGKGKIKLLDQPMTVQEVVRAAIDQAMEDVIMQKAWPEEKVRPTYGRDQLLQASRSATLLSSNDRKHLEELQDVLKKDPRTAKLLGSVVTARLSLVRAPAKVEAGNSIPYYKLGLGTNCEEWVQSLMTKFVFHMPGSWGVGPTQNIYQQEWQPNRKEAFLAKPVIDTIKSAYFSTHQSIGRRYEEQFASSLPTASAEREIPISLLALGMTAVYASLYEFRNGHKEVSDFDGNTFLSVNQELVSILERLKNDQPVFFHNRMHKIYKLVSDTPTRTPVIHDGAYGVIEFE